MSKKYKKRVKRYIVSIIRVHDEFPVDHFFYDEVVNYGWLNRSLASFVLRLSNDSSLSSWIEGYDIYVGRAPYDNPLNKFHQKFNRFY